MGPVSYQRFLESGSAEPPPGGMERRGGFGMATDEAAMVM